MSAQLSYVAEQVRRYDRDRFVTALFAPSERREALFALYAFNVEIARVRELVREPMLGQVRLQWWRDALAGIRDGAPPPHPLAPPLMAAMRAHGLSPATFERLIDARETDMAEAPPPTLAALEDYAEGTAATLTWLALEVLDARDAVAFEVGRRVGLAWALTGLLRATAFLAASGRTYLPEELLVAHGVATCDVLGGKSSPGLVAATGVIAERARTHLAAARLLRRDVPRRALPALLPAVLADRYLAALARRGGDVFAAGWAEPRPRPLLLAAKAMLGRY